MAVNCLPPNEAAVSFPESIVLKTFIFLMNRKRGADRPGRSKVKGAGCALVEPLTAQDGLYFGFGGK